MVAGIPGAGIGGLFYLLAAFSLPLRLVRRWWRGERRPPAGDGSWRQVGMALGIVAGIWLAGWMLGLIVVHGGMGRVPSVTGAPRFPGAFGKRHSDSGGARRIRDADTGPAHGRAWAAAVPSRTRRSSNDTLSRHWE